MVQIIIDVTLRSFIPFFYLIQVSQFHFLIQVSQFHFMNDENTCCLHSCPISPTVLSIVRPSAEVNNYAWLCTLIQLARKSSLHLFNFESTNRFQQNIEFWCVEILISFRWTISITDKTVVKLLSFVDSFNILVFPQDLFIVVSSG